MTHVAVSGIVSVRLTRPVETFPVPRTPGQVCDGALGAHLAGAGWTVATTLRALGADVTFATYVGADPLGLVAAHGLRARGWYGRATARCAEQPRSVNLYDNAGVSCGLSDLRGAWDLRYPAELFGALLDDKPADAVLLSSIGFTRPLIDVTLDRGLPMATDMQCVIDADYPRKQDWLRAATIVNCSHEKLRAGPLGWIESLWRRFGTPVAVVGCGADGTLVGLHDSRQVWHVAAAPPRGVRFTGGAGDTLLAAFVHCFLDLGDPVASARFAALAAGWFVGGGPAEEFTLSAAELSDLSIRCGLPTVRRVR
jgi:sugar/nucleoside kinase (ribokinase family)